MAGSTAQFPLTSAQAHAVKRSLQKAHRGNSFRIVGRAPHYFVEEREVVRDEEGQPTLSYSVTVHGRPHKRQPQRQRQRRSQRIVTAADQIKPVRAA